MKNKICKICKIEKSLTEFHKLRKWNASYCKPCQSVFIKEWRLKNRDAIKRKKRIAYLKFSTPELRRRNKYMHRYGITMEDYKNFYNSQNGVCAICLKTETGKKRFLSVDHCHKTDKVRGLLCDKCNNMLGRAEDNPMVLMSASLYLEENAK